MNLRRVALYSVAATTVVVALGATPLIFNRYSSQPLPHEVPTLQSTLTDRGWSFGETEAAQSDLALVPIDSITLERGPCYGDCPIYRMTLHKSGRAELTRDHMTPERAVSFSGQVQLFHFARLAQLAVLAKEAATESSYAGEWTDDYTVEITATSDDGTWRVSDYGQVAPPAVWALEELLHATYLSTKWERRGAGT